MNEEIINEMYLLAVKSKLQRGAISVEERLSFILCELNLRADEKTQVESCYTSISTPLPIEQSSTVLQTNTIPKQDEKSLKIIGHKYAEQPEDDGFINRELELDKELKHIYDIQLTNDATIAYYELITDGDRSVEYMRSPSLVPEYVVVFDTSPSGSDAQLVKVKSGVLKRSGKIWKIVEPCHMRWC